MSISISQHTYTIESVRYLAKWIKSNYGSIQAVLECLPFEKDCPWPTKTFQDAAFIVQFCERLKPFNYDADTMWAALPVCDKYPFRVSMSGSKT